MSAPFYLPQHEELALFEHAYKLQLPLLLKGPTGCGKSRLVEHMAHRLGRPLVSVAANEDTSAVDLLGRHLIEGGETRWQDGPATRAVRQGAVLYLDEIAEARADVLVVLHPLSDHRRALYLDRLHEQLEAGPEFMLVASYNPGYQHSLKELKPSTRQRFVTISLGSPSEALERKIVEHEGRVDAQTAARLVRLVTKLRQAQSLGLRESPSTRQLIYAARLIAAGVTPRLACQVAIAQALSDDRQTLESLYAAISIAF